MSHDLKLNSKGKINKYALKKKNSLNIECRNNADYGYNGDGQTPLRPRPQHPHN